MSIRDDFTNDVKSGAGDRIESASYRPNIEVWPEEDDFGKWVASHQDKVRMVICASPEFADSPYCGRGHH